MDFLSSFFLGLFFVFLTFLLCLILVVGIKFTCVYFKLLFPKKQVDPPKKDKTEEKPENKPQRKRKTIRSIEINPDEVDRIYVKKIS